MQLESVREMVAGLSPVECSKCEKWHPQGFKCEPDGNTDGEDTFEGGEHGEAECREFWQQRIYEDALDAATRSGWRTPSDDHKGETDEEYFILLCTGGPAVRIIGNLDEHGCPDSARIEHQDWGAPWTDMPMSGVERDDVVTYAQQLIGG
jgi:hypothetical protein